MTQALFATAPILHGLPGVPRSVPDYMQGEQRAEGRIIEVAGWHRWSDKKKLRWMRAFVKRYAQDPGMNTFVAQKVFQGVPSRDFRSQAAAILRWTQQNITYVNEPGEIIRSPWRCITDRTGDCDDMAILMACFAEAVALPWRFVLAGKYRGRPIRCHENERFPWGVKFHHIYVEVGYPPFSANPTWVSLEPTIKNAPAGYDVVRDGYSTDANGAAQIPELAGFGAPLGMETVERRNIIVDIRNAFPLPVLIVEGMKAVVIGFIASFFTMTAQRIWRASTRTR